MNTTRRIQFFLSIAIAMIATACVEDDEFKVPEVSLQEPVIDGTVIQPTAIAGMLFQAIEAEGELAKVSFENTNNYMVGYVISNDKAGNFFEELIVQDASTNPKGGIRILVDTNPLFITYEFGRKVFLKLDGLSAGLQNGVPTLGVLAGNEIANIPSFLQKEFIIRATEVVSIAPKEISMEDFSEEQLHQYIKINEVQFARNQLRDDDPFTFAAEPTDQFNGKRTLESCATGRRAILSTSTFSDFKGLQLPKGRGSVEGIVTKDFFGDTFILKINDPSGIIFENPERCDPDVLKCNEVGSGSTIIFEENFATKSIIDLENEGWINENGTGGNLLYSIGNFGENRYAQITGFDSNEPLYEVWLITPEIDLTNTSFAQLYLDVQASYDNNARLSAWVTNAFTGSATSNWIQLDAVVPQGPANDFGEFQPVGPVNLSCLQGKIRIGFKYTGGDPGQTTRFHIDNLKITGD